MKMLNFILDRRNYIAVYVIGYLVRGIIYHFFPFINEILMWITIIWPVIIIWHDIFSGFQKPDSTQVSLYLFLFFALLSTLINIKDVLAYDYYSRGEVSLSLWNAVSLIYILFGNGRKEEKRSYQTFINQLIKII